MTKSNVAFQPRVDNAGSNIQNNEIDFDLSSNNYVRTALNPEKIKSGIKIISLCVNFNHLIML